jgi:hypothetical protein
VVGIALAGHCPQRPEQRRAQDEREAEPQPGIGKMLALSPRSATRLEETDLPEQRTRDRQLDRDDGLEVLNGYVHGRISMNDSYVRPIRTFDRPTLSR